LGIQEVIWHRGDNEPAGHCTFFYGNGNENHEFEAGFFIHKRIRSAVRRMEFSGVWKIYI
jgi:hypothetical protein